MSARSDKHEIRIMLERNRGNGVILDRPSAMGDKSYKETVFQEMDAHQVAAKTTLVRVLIREAKKRGYTIQDILALLDEPGMTPKEVIKRILSAPEN
jgi:hypothetical protein